MSIHYFKGKHKMFKIIEKVAQVFETTRKSRLEQYIINHNPQTNAEVEQLTREFEAQPEIWARGL